MNEIHSAGIKQLDSVELHPSHESWAHITTHNNFVAFLIFLVFAALFVVTINLHLSPGHLRSLGLFVGMAAAVVIVWVVWRSRSRRHRGFLANAELAAHIKGDLMTELGVSHVNVASSNGAATLRGTVPYADFRGAAEQLARQDGAQKVVDELTVAGSAPARPESYLQGLPGVTTPEGAPEVERGGTLAERVREALEDDPRVNANVMRVGVEDGIAYLTGRQGTTIGGNAATEVAAHVPGVLGVSNEIEIIADA